MICSVRRGDERVWEIVRRLEKVHLVNSEHLLDNFHWFKVEELDGSITLWVFGYFLLILGCV